MIDKNKIQEFLSEIILDNTEIANSIKAITSELDELKRKQGALLKSISLLNNALEKGGNEELAAPQNEIDLTKDDMAKQITKEKKVIQLKNGQASSYFEDKVNLTDFNIPTEAIIEFCGIENLVWNSEKSKFEGTPEKAGEYIGTLSYWLNEQDKNDSKPSIPREVHFLVNPDPRSLWQNIDPPSEGPYHKENKLFIKEKCAKRTILGVSVRGKSHAHKGTFRDDDLAIECWDKTGWRLQVVADGAGSAEYSREGSKIACETTVSVMNNFIESNDLTLFEELLSKRFQDENDDVSEEIAKSIYQITVGTAFKAHKAINEFAEKEGKLVKSFATTLLFALSKEFDFGTIVITFSVGDGAIGSLTKSEGSLLIKPDEGEYSGQTRFLTMPEIFKPENPEDIRNRYKIRCFTENVIALFLMSDGISDPKFGTDNALKDSDNWFALWDDLKPIIVDQEPNEKVLFEWIDFYIQGEYDDRTISILF